MLLAEIAAWCALILTGILAGLIYWRRPPTPLWPSIFFVYVSAFIWVIGEIYTSFHAEQEFAYHIGLMVFYAGLLCVMPTWWLFSYAFAEHVGLPFKNNSRIIRYGPFGLALFFWLLLATNPWHGQFIVANVGALNDYRVGWYLAAGTSYLLMLAVAARLIHLRWKARHSTVRGQITILIAGTMVPIVGNVLFITRTIDIRFDLTVTMFTISGLLFFIGIYRDRLFALSPVALQHVIRNEHDGILLVDTNFRLVHNNPAVEWFFGPGEIAPYEDVLAALANRVVLDDASESNHSPNDLLRALERDRKAGDNHTYRYTSDTCEYVNIDLTDVPNFRGDILVRVVRLRDVTAQTKAENALRDLAHGFTSVSSDNYFSELTLYIANTLGAKYVLVGRIEQTDIDRVHTIAMCQDGKIVDNVTYDLADTPCQDVFSGELCYFPSGVQYEYPKDLMLQEMGAIAYAGVPLLDSKGTPIGILTILHDTPLEDRTVIESILKVFAPRSASELERMLVERELESSRKLLDEAQEIADIGAWRWDMRADKVVWSNTMFRIFGQDPMEFTPTSKNISDPVHPDDHEATRAVIVDAFNNRDGYDTEFRIIRPDGSIRAVQSRASIYRDDQRIPVRVVGTTQDITNQRQLESQNLTLERQLLQSQKLESLGTLAGGIAHDFNNILQAILGYTALARERALEDDTMQSYLSRIEDGSKRATDLIRQILTFSGQDEFELREIDLAIIVNDAIEFLRHAIPSTIHLEVDIPDEPCNAMAGPVQIHQLVTNLCTNSMHAMDDARGTLSVTLKRRHVENPKSILGNTLETGAYNEIVIQDTGSGISSKDIDRLFDPFFTTKEVGKGTGLGLAVVHGILRRLNGGISVDSELGKGTTIRVLIPLSSSSPPPHDVIPAVQHQPQLDSANGHRHILVVDDEVAITRFLKLLLEKRGHTVDVFNDPEEALTHLAANDTPDLALLDYTMPKLNGLELAQQLDELYPALHVVIATGNLDVAPLEKAKPENVKSILRKPFQIEEILSATER